MKWPFGPRPALDPRAAPISGATPDVARPPRARAGVARRARVGSRTRLRLDGARAVWLPAGVIGAVMAAIVLWQLAIPRDFYTGTNSIGVRSVVANLVPGQKLCVPGLNLPAGTGRVQLALFAHRPQFTARLAVSTASRDELREGRRHPRPDVADLRVAPIPVRPAQPSSVPATVCMTPLDGPLAVGGMIGLQANQVSPRVNGAPLGSRVGVWFLPPAGEHRSLFASLGAIFYARGAVSPGDRRPLDLPVPAVRAAARAFGCCRCCCWRGRRGQIAAAARAHAAPRRGDRLDRVRQRRLVGADHAGLQRARRARPLRLRAVLRRNRATRPARVPDARAPYSTDQTSALNAVDVYSQVELPDGRPPWLGRRTGQVGTRTRLLAAPCRQRRRRDAAAPPPTSPPTTRCSRLPTRRCARSRRSRSSPRCGWSRRCSGRSWRPVRSGSCASCCPASRWPRWRPGCWSRFSRCSDSSQARSTTTTGSTPLRRCRCTC